MTAPLLTRTYCTRRNIPLLDTTSLAQITKSWALALMRSETNTEVTGTLFGARHANSVWNHLRSCDGSGGAISVNPAVNLWAGLAAIVGNSSGSNHSWIVLENPTSGYQCCIDMNTTLTGGFFRIVFTKITSPFSTGTATVAPTSANEWTVGVVAGGLTAGFTFLHLPVVLSGQMMFHYSASQDGEFFTLMNRIGAFCFDTFFCFQKTENNNVGDTCNAFTTAQPTSSNPGGRGVPTMVTAGSSPWMSGRGWNDTQPMGAGGILNMTYGGTAWITSVTYKDQPTNEYPAFRLDMASVAIAPALRGNFRDWYATSIEISRIGQVFPTVASPTHVVAGEFLIPFVGGPPNM